MMTREERAILSVAAITAVVLWGMIAVGLWKIATGAL